MSCSGVRAGLSLPGGWPHAAGTAGPAVILISTYTAADFARPIADSPATGFLTKQELSADAIRRIVDGRGPAGPPGAPAR